MENKSAAPVAQVLVPAQEYIPNFNPFEWI